MNSATLSISYQTYRRYILGAQGLWPGRRWRGKLGILAAIRQMESVQVDPVIIIAPSHEINLWGRVLEFKPDDLDALLYDDRRLFDYGGNVNIYPIEEFPYWKFFMARRKTEERWAIFADQNMDLISQVLREVKSQGTLRKRDLGGNALSNYRGTKDSGLALYYLWLTGSLMSHSRQGRDRVYALTEKIAPAWMAKTVSDESARHFHLMKEISQHGLMDERTFRQYYNHIWQIKLNLAQAREKLAGYRRQGKLSEIRIEGTKSPFYLPTENFSHLEIVNKGKFPESWEPLQTTTSEEVVFLSPLERVSARGRAKELFDFEYIWEIYKPEAKRTYGPYTLPILFDDRLVGRMDARLDRGSSSLVVNGLWLEDWFSIDKAFVRAFSKGLINFLQFLDTERIDNKAIRNPEISNLFERNSFGNSTI